MFLLLFFIMAGAWCAEECVPSEQTWVHHWSDCGKIRSACCRESVCRRVCCYSLPQGEKSYVKLNYAEKKDLVTFEDKMTYLGCDVHHKSVAVGDCGEFLNFFIRCKLCEEIARGSVLSVRSSCAQMRLIFNLPGAAESIPVKNFRINEPDLTSDDFCEYRVNRRSMGITRKLFHYRDGTKFFLQADARYDDLRKVVVSCGVLDRDNNVQSVEPFDFDFSGLCACASDVKMRKPLDQ